jgi:hypothetical protein
MFFTLILSLLLIVQGAFVHKFGFFLQLDNTNSFRFMSLRLTDGEGLINIGILLAMATIFNKKMKFSLLPYTTLIIGFIEVVFVQKTRVALFGLLMAFLIVWLAQNKKKIGKLVFFFLILLFLFMFIQNTSVFAEYMNSFSTNDYSYTARSAEIQFYFSQLYNNLFFGMGFIPSNLDMLIQGPEGVFYKSDVGIIGFFNTFGFIGGIWFILLIVKIIKVLAFSIKTKTIYNNYETLLLVIYIIFTSLTLDIMDPQRIIGLPILIAFADYLYHSNKNKIGETNGNRKELI